MEGKYFAGFICILIIFNSFKRNNELNTIIKMNVSFRQTKIKHIFILKLIIYIKMHTHILVHENE